MNRKGFTLIELIATIALLGIIVTISFISINKVIEQSKENDCESLLKSIKTAANDYASDKRYSESINSIVANGITVQDLIEGEYISNPVNPYNKSEINPNYIKITYSFNKNLTVNSISVTYNPDGEVTEETFCKQLKG